MHDAKYLKKNPHTQERKRTERQREGWWRTSLVFASDWFLATTSEGASVLRTWAHCTFFAPRRSLLSHMELQSPWFQLDAALCGRVVTVSPICPVQRSNYYCTRYEIENILSSDNSMFLPWHPHPFSPEVTPLPLQYFLSNVPGAGGVSSWFSCSETALLTVSWALLLLLVPLAFEQWLWANLAFWAFNAWEKSRSSSAWSIPRPGSPLPSHPHLHSFSPGCFSSSCQRTPKALSWPAWPPSLSGVASDNLVLMFLWSPLNPGLWLLSAELSSSLHTWSKNFFFPLSPPFTLITITKVTLRSLSLHLTLSLHPRLDFHLCWTVISWCPQHSCSPSSCPSSNL